MKIAELITADALKPQLDRIKKLQQALKVRKAAIKAQQQLRAAKTPTVPLS